MILSERACIVFLIAGTPTFTTMIITINQARPPQKISETFGTTGLGAEKQSSTSWLTFVWSFAATASAMACTSSPLQSPSSAFAGTVKLTAPAVVRGWISGFGVVSAAAAEAAATVSGAASRNPAAIKRRMRMARPLLRVGKRLR